MATPEYDDTYCPVVLANKLVEANATLDAFVEGIHRNQFPPSIDEVEAALYWLAFVVDVDFCRPPAAIKMVTSSRGVDYRKLAAIIPAYQRTMNKVIAAKRASREAELTRLAYRNDPTRPDDDVPF